MKKHDGMVAQLWCSVFKGSEWDSGLSQVPHSTCGCGVARTPILKQWTPIIWGKVPIYIPNQDRKEKFSCRCLMKETTCGLAHLHWWAWTWGLASPQQLPLWPGGVKSAAGTLLSKSSKSREQRPSQNRPELLQEQVMIDGYLESLPLSSYYSTIELPSIGGVKETLLGIVWSPRLTILNTSVMYCSSCMLRSLFSKG